MLFDSNLGQVVKHISLGFTYLSFARSGIGAVFLVDDDGIVDVVHDDVFEFDVGGSDADRRGLP